MDELVDVDVTVRKEDDGQLTISVTADIEALHSVFSAEFLEDLGNEMRAARQARELPQ